MTEIACIGIGLVIGFILIALLSLFQKLRKKKEASLEDLQSEAAKNQQAKIQQQPLTLQTKKAEPNKANTPTIVPIVDSNEETSELSNVEEDQMISDLREMISDLQENLKTSNTENEELKYFLKSEQENFDRKYKALHQDTNKALEELVEDSDNKQREVIIQKNNHIEKVLHQTRERYKKIINGASTVIYAEGFITAGPRKNKDQRDALGDDTCGFMLLNNRLLFWVLDGTSGLDKIRDQKTGREIFSSRVLAQSIANKFPDVFLRAEHAPIEQLAEQAILAAQKDWSTILQKSQVDWGLRKDFQFGTTLIVGVLNKEGELDAYRIGDSSLAAFNQKGKLLESASFYGKTSVRDNQFFVLKKDTQGVFKVQKNIAQGERIHGRDVDFLTCFSDGVNNTIVKKIQHHSISKLEELRSLIYNTSQNSEDDKSLILAKVITTSI